MTLALDAGIAWRALQQRLGAVTPVLLDGTSAEPEPPELLDQLVRTVQRDLTRERVWLLFVAVAARYPTGDEMLDALRTFELSDATAAILWLLDTSLEGAHLGSGPTRHLILATGAVLVDVDNTARHVLHTGIQQVVRHLLPRWMAEHDVIPVAWTARAGGHRALSESELVRASTLGAPPPGQDDDLEEGPLMVPWRSLVVMAEVPSGDVPEKLATLAQFSGSALVAIGYDCIPVVSADLLPSGVSVRFASYLSVVKHAQAVAAISVSSAAEFAGFAATLPSRGLRGPRVTECMLPTALDAGPTPRLVPRRRPLVVMVGSYEPRKNHLGVLHASEMLWRSGLDFELLLIGGSGWGADIPNRVTRLKAAGRPITVQHQVDDATLQQSYRAARFTVLPSLHEGFGLPVVESLAAGTPVITSDFGSLRELASEGGAIMIDPHDDDAIEGAMRRLLTDDGELERLRREIGTRPPRDWDDYGRDLWDVMIAPAQVPLTLDSP